MPRLCSCGAQLVVRYTKDGSDGPFCPLCDCSHCPACGRPIRNRLDDRCLHCDAVITLTSEVT